MENILNEFDSRLNTQLLFELYEDDMEHAACMFEQFLLLIPDLMNEIETEFKTGNIEPFRQKIHKIKPVFSMVGISSMTEQAEYIEKECKQITTIHEIRENYIEFKKNYEEYIPIIKSELIRLENQNS